MPFTLRQIADKVAARDGRDPDRVHTQLRNSTIRRLMGPLPGERGSTSAVKYPARELIRARVLLALIDMGFDVLTVGEFNDALLALRSSRDDDGEGLDALIEGARCGEKWRFHIRFYRQDGERLATGMLARHQQNADQADGPAAAAAEEGTFLGEVMVPVSDLIQPLLADLEGQS